MAAESIWSVTSKKKFPTRKINSLNARNIPLDLVASYLLEVNISIGKKSTQISLNGVPA